MLEVKVFGGLGNQMFQYAFYRYLLQNNDVMLNISDYLVHRHHQGFELDRVFNLSGSYYNKEESHIAIHANSVIIRLLQKLLRARIAREAEYYEHKEVSFVPDIQFHTDVYFVGFWQDVRYVEPIKADLLKDFSFAKLDKRNADFMNSIADRETVSVHVRRGDYLTSASLGNVCNNEYYSKAIEFIQEHVKNPLFVFFSDDIEWCKENFNHIDAKYVDWNSGGGFLSGYAADDYVQELYYCKQ
ncbi:MAG: alpha-1,2-fucosyltransferase [Eubacteriales bacterium]|nr:alpha-1,2-fucosyltransferase [Eubacteriales bacterium]